MTELYKLSDDRAESKNISAQFPEKVQAMTAKLAPINESFQQSHAGKDYNDPEFTPVDRWLPDIDKEKAVRRKTKKRNNLRRFSNQCQ